MTMAQSHRRAVLSRIFARLVFGKDMHRHHHIRLCEQECGHVKECYDVLVYGLEGAYGKGVYARGRYDEIRYRMEYALQQMTSEGR